MKSIMVMAGMAGALMAAEASGRDVFSARSFHKPETTDKIRYWPQQLEGLTQIVVEAGDLNLDNRCAIPLREFKPNWSSKKDHMTIAAGPVGPAGGTVAPMVVCKGWN